MSPCVTYNENERGEPNREQAQTRQKWGQDETETQMRSREGGTVTARKGRQRHWLCHGSLLSHGGGDVCSHAPVVRLKNPGLLHSIQPSSSTHGCLAGKELVIPPPPSLHPLLSTSLFPTPQASAFCLLRQAPVFPGHHVTRKQAAPFSFLAFLFFFLCIFFVRDAGEHKQHSQQSRWCLHLQEAALILKIKCGPIEPSRPGSSTCRQKRFSNLGERKWTVII